MRKLLFITLVLAVVLPMSSCRRAVEKARRNIRIEAVEKIKLQGMTGIDLVLRLKNGTNYKLVLDRAALNLYYAEDCVAQAVLREKIEVARLTTGSVTTQWKLRVSDPLALYALVRKVGQGDLSKINVSYELEGRGGPIPAKSSSRIMPLSEFLHIFGVDIEHVKKLLKE